jgi:hypothetical protein
LRELADIAAEAKKRLTTAVRSAEWNWGGHAVLGDCVFRSLSISIGQLVPALAPKHFPLLRLRFDVVGDLD